MLTMGLLVMPILYMEIRPSTSGPLSMTFQCPAPVTIRLWENSCPISISASQMVLCFREWFYQACLLPRDPSSDPICSFMRIFFSFMRLFSFMRICCCSFPTDLLKQCNLEANVTHFLPVHRMLFRRRH